MSTAPAEGSRPQRIKVADEVWIATALLHRESPEREDFTVREIVERARAERLAGEARPSLRVHAIQHCVANRPPSPARYRMLFATGKSTRRLFRPGDPSHPDRRGAKTAPRKEELPEKYRPLLDWYRNEYVLRHGPRAAPDPLLGLRGVGGELWRDEDPDAYVRRLRTGWE